VPAATPTPERASFPWWIVAVAVVLHYYI